MGLGQSQEDRKNKIIDRFAQRDFEIDKGRVKLLLLGTGESGKSTLLKQMKLLYGTKDQLEYANADQSLTVKSIRSCVLANLQELVRSTNLFFPLNSPQLEQYDANLQKLSVALDSQRAKFSQEEIAQFRALWESKPVQRAWKEKRNMIQVQDSLIHFMTKLEKIFGENFIPSEEDWLRVRVRTSGIVEEAFRLDGVEFHIVDVGGQRNERKKWLHCFSNVRAVIYVVALNEYDQLLFEDNSINRMSEAIEQFEKVVNDDALAACGWILFLNKSDLYKDKLPNSPIKYEHPSDSSQSRFLDYGGFDLSVLPDSERDKGAQYETKFEKAYKDGIDYFAMKFRSKLHSPSSKDLYTHVTCAMDQHNVFVVFNACRGMILKEMMEAQGFIRNDL